MLVLVVSLIIVMPGIRAERWRAVLQPLGAS
jgi:hypothetical protein